MNTLGDALPQEIARVTVLLGHYREIGPAGQVGAYFIETDLAEANQAIVSGDVVRMLQAYKRLQEYTE